MNRSETGTEKKPEQEGSGGVSDLPWMGECQGWYESFRTGILADVYAILSEMIDEHGTPAYTTEGRYREWFAEASLSDLKGTRESVRSVLEGRGHHFPEASA